MISNTKSMLSRELIEKLVRANFGEEAAVETIDELTEGCFNAIYILGLSGAGDLREVVLKTGIQDGKYILTYEKEIMRTEVRVYEMLAKTEVPVPRVLKHDFSHSLIDCDYFFMEKLNGQTWDELKDSLSAENKERLHHALGRYAALIHQLKGEYFGYIKDDESFQFASWREAFRSFVDRIIADGRRDGVRLPYVKILKTFEPLWPLLDAVTEPSLINYDLWSKNILLANKPDGEYVIEGIIDHERAFYGDPYAEFISTVFVCGDLEKAESFQQGYAEGSGKPFSFTREEQIRYWMYSVYMGLLLGVEIYRYEKVEKIKFLMMSRYVIHQGLSKLKGLTRNR